MTEDELWRMLDRWTPAQIQGTLHDLSHRGQAQAVERHGQRFWSSAEARYVDDQLSRGCSAPPPALHHRTDET